jgi:flagellar hook-length control protein FliK
MSLEITSTPPMSPIMPSQSGSDQLQGQDGGKTNPFASLLAGLDAVQQPQISAITETTVASTSKPLMTPLPMAGELTPETNIASIDALKAFMGPAFNSRLSLAQSEDLTKSVSIVTSTNAAPPAPVEMAASLLNLLNHKTQAPVTIGAAEAVIEQVAVDELQLLPNDLLPTPVAEILVAQESTEELEEPTIDDEVATVELIETANIIVPASVETKPIVIANPVSSETDTDIASSGSDKRISLFDKLSSSAREPAEATPDSNSDAAPVEAPTADTALPVSSAETNVQTHKAPEPPQTAQLQPAVQNDSPAPPRDLPQVTMRPVNEAQMVEGVSVLLARASRNQVNEFIIRMDPPELGRIEVQMKMSEDGTVQAVIASDNPNTHDLLRREASTIERALNESGFRTGNDGLSFNLKQQGSDQQRQTPEKYASGPSNGTVAADDNIPSSVFAPLRQRYENARINISA